MLPLTRRPSSLTRLAGATLAGALALVLAVGVLSTPAQAANKPQPDDFRGRGFDQCLAPTQSAMDRWMKYSPFQAVGIYTSGNQRACLRQPNLTPTWIASQIRNGWRLLPITLGPQAECNPRFPRYGRADISTSSTNRYARARAQGHSAGVNAVKVAKGLGINPGSTLWYDLEGFDHTVTRCARSSMAFLHGWTNAMHGLHYVSGVYSSAGSGMVILEQERVDPSWYKWVLPDRIWIADWDGRANTRTTYISDEGWSHGNRMKQYRGGHNETHGGVTINIDSNWLTLGRAWRASSEISRCGGVNINFGSYGTLVKGTNQVGRVKALQCLLKAKRRYSGPIDGIFDDAVITAANRYRTMVGRAHRDSWRPGDWTSLLSHGTPANLKRYSTDPYVRRLQRTLNAALSAGLSINGHFDAATQQAVATYQSRTGLPSTGHATDRIWKFFLNGAR